MASRYMKLLAPLLRKLGLQQIPKEKVLEVAVPIPPEKPIVFGIPETIKPVRGVDLKAEAKLILRAGFEAELVMLTEQQDSAFRLEDRGEYWIVDSEIRREILIK
jgi:hypothetical protein